MSLEQEQVGISLPALPEAETSPSAAPEVFPVWITKWCLGVGIKRAIAAQYPGVPEWCVILAGPMKSAMFQGDDWHKTEVAALKRADKVRVGAMDRARERIAELEAMTFDGGTDEESI